MNDGYYINAAIYGVIAFFSFTLSLYQFYLGYYRPQNILAVTSTTSSTPIVRTLLVCCVFGASLLVIRAIDPDGCFHAYDESFRQYSSVNCTTVILTGFVIWLVQLFDSVSNFDEDGKSVPGSTAASSTGVRGDTENGGGGTGHDIIPPGADGAHDHTPGERRLTQNRATKSRARGTSCMAHGMRVAMATLIITANVGTGIAHAIDRWWPTAVFLGITAVIMMFLLGVLWYATAHVRIAINHAKQLYASQASAPAMTASSLSISGPDSGLAKLNAAERKLNTVHISASLLLIVSAIINLLVCIDRIDSSESLREALACTPDIYDWDTLLWCQAIAVMLGQAYVWQPLPKIKWSCLCCQHWSFGGGGYTKQIDPTVRVRIRGSSYSEDT